MRALMIIKRIEVTPGFLAFLCAYYYFDPAHTFFPFLFSSVAHELGHLVALLAMKLPVNKIRIGAGGASIQTAPMRYSQMIFAAAAGPVVNFLLLLLLLHIDPAAALVNLCLLTYNMLPIYPMDGGRILRSLLHLLLSDKIANAVERLASASCLLTIVIAACYLTCVWHAGLWPVLVSALLIVKTADTFYAEKQVLPGGA